MDGDALWQSVIGEIELSVSRASYVTWFKNTRLLRLSEDEVVVGVLSTFVKQNLETKHFDLVKSTLAKNGITTAELKFQIHTPRQKQVKEPDSDEEDAQVRLDTLVPRPGVQSIARPGFTSNNSVSHSYRQGLNHRYTFDNFVTGSGNDLAYAACQAIADNPGQKYNPLFVYGGVGIGKTHLIQAVGNEVLRQNPKAKVMYVTIEQFVQEFTDSIRYKKAGSFAQHYRSADVLIIDDIQFIAGKEKTQEEFFHTFNVLHQANKQVIISSDKPPHAIPTLEDRLRSRFQMGMSIDMQAPDLETRIAILKMKADSYEFDIEQPCLEFLAENFTTNIRELEGAFNQLMAYCDMRGVEATADIARIVFAKMSSRPKHVSPKQIVDKVTKYYRLKTEEILGPKRDKDIVVPRQIAMYLLRSELKMSFPKIAVELGRKDHTTALHSVEKIQRELVVDLVLKQQIQEIKEMING